MVKARALTLLSAVVLGTAADSCCCAPGAGEHVQMGDQTNIVVWNPSTHTEHFIRKASFTSRAQDFAFIAPTPSVPQLGLASDHAFTLLASLKPKPNSWLGQAKSAAKSASDTPLVVQEQDIGDYHAVTLKASDNAGLNKYLADNGYPASKEIAAWTAYYVAKSWYLTAFKLRRGEDPRSTSIAQGTVRMSFKTDQPFNPYRVPRSNAGNGTLTVYFVSGGPYEATVAGKTWDNKRWSADVPDPGTLAHDLGIAVSDIPSKAYVTAFAQSGWTVEPAEDDIVFKPAAPTAEIALGAVVGCAVAVGVALFARSRKKPSALSSK